MSVLVYRDLLLAPSETFIPRMYKGFGRLEPVFAGTRRGSALAALGHPHRFVGEGSAWPGLSALLFKEQGRVPRAFRDWALAEDARLVHAQFGKGGAFALPLARALGLPLVVTFHGGDATKARHYRKRPLLQPVFQRRLEALKTYATCFFCVSEFIRNTLIERGFPPDKLEVHRLGIELPPEDRPLPQPGSQRLLFVGRLVEKKGVADLLAAMRELRSAWPAAKLDLAGDGPLRAELEERTRSEGLNAVFHGWLKPDEVDAMMRDAHALVVPSRTAGGGDAEGLPTVVFEAQARGLPVVATRHAGIPEAIEDGETGLLVKEGDVHGLARAVLRLREEPGLWRHIQATALASCRTHFDAQRQSEKLQERLGAIIEAAGRP